MLDDVNVQAAYLEASLCEKVQPYGLQCHVREGMYHIRTLSCSCCHLTDSWLSTIYLVIVAVCLQHCSYLLVHLRAQRTKFHCQKGQLL